MTDHTDNLQITGDEPISNSLAPDIQGPRAKAYFATLQAGVDYAINLSMTAARGYITNIQTLWVDNSAGLNTLTISVRGTQQVLRVAAGDARYIPVLCNPLNPIFVVNRADAGVLPIIFINVPIPTSNPGFDAASIVAQLITLLADVGATNEAVAATPSTVSGLHGLIAGLWTKILSATSTSDASRVPVDERDGVATSGSISSATTLMTVDMLGFESATLQLTSVGSGNTFAFEVCDDNTTWLPTFAQIITATQQASFTNAVGTINTATIYELNAIARYARVRVSVYGSGTVAGLLTQRKRPRTIEQHASVQGDRPQGSAIASNAVRTGRQARTSNNTAVANATVCDDICTVIGVGIQKPYSIPEAEWNYAAAAGGIVNTTTAVTIAAAAGAGLRNYLVRLDLNSDVLITASEIVIRDGAGGTVLWRGKLQAATNSFERTFHNPLRGTANTLMEVCTLTATGAVVATYFNAGGYIAP